MKPFVTGFLSGCGVLIVAISLIRCIPSESLEGTSHGVLTHRIPLWEKAARFYLRHLEFERLAAEAAGGEADSQRRVLRLVDWTRATVVHPIPPGLPVIDDHIAHIVLRHYGNDGQLAEVFTALTTYTGNDGCWSHTTPPGAKGRVVLSFVQSEDGWWVFDVSNGGWFETADGRIARVEDFRHPETLRRRGQAPAVLHGIPYLAYYQDLEAVWKRSFSRARGQMPWHRLLQVVGLEPEDGCE